MSYYGWDSLVNRRGPCNDRAPCSLKAKIVLKKAFRSVTWKASTIPNDRVDGKGVRVWVCVP